MAKSTAGSSRKSAGGTAQVTKDLKLKQARGKTGGRIASDACALCHRQWTESNPLKFNQKMDTLPRAKGHGTRCDICVGTLRHVGASDVDAQIQACATEEGLSSWMEKVHSYERKRNREVDTMHEGLSSVPDSVEGPHGTIHSVHDDDLISEVCVSHFWPAPEFTDFMGREPRPNELEDGQDMHGNDCVGVYRKPHLDKLPLPAGVVVIKRRRKHGLSKKRLEDDTREHIVEGQDKAVYAQLKRKLDVIVCANADDDDQATLSLSRPSPPMGVDIEDSDDDFAILRPAKARKATGETPSMEGSKSSVQARKSEQATAVHKLDSTVGSEQTQVKMQRQATLMKKKPPAKEHVPKPSPQASPKASPRGSASSSSSGWLIRQKAQREVQAAEKVVGPLETLSKHLHEEHCRSSAAEAQSLLNRCEARLDGSVRWVYCGDDLSVDDNEGRKKREQLFERLKAGARELSFMTPILKASQATKTKDQESYSPTYFRSVLGDAHDADLVVPMSMLEKYLDRHVKELVLQACDNITSVWGTTIAEITDADATQMMSCTDLFKGFGEAIDVSKPSQDGDGLTYIAFHCTGSDAEKWISKLQRSALMDAAQKVFGFDFVLPENIEPQDSDNDDDEALQQKSLVREKKFEDMKAMKLKFELSFVSMLTGVCVAQEVKLCTGNEDQCAPQTVFVTSLECFYSGSHV